MLKYARIVAFVAICLLPASQPASAQRFMTPEQCEFARRAAWREIMKIQKQQSDCTWAVDRTDRIDLGTFQYCDSSNELSRSYGAYSTCHRRYEPPLCNAQARRDEILEQCRSIKGLKPAARAIDIAEQASKKWDQAKALKRFGDDYMEGGFAFAVREQAKQLAMNGITALGGRTIGEFTGAQLRTFKSYDPNAPSSLSAGDQRRLESMYEKARQLLNSNQSAGVVAIQDIFSGAIMNQLTEFDHLLSEVEALSASFNVEDAREPSAVTGSSKGDGLVPSARPVPPPAAQTSRAKPDDSPPRDDTPWDLDKCSVTVSHFERTREGDEDEIRRKCRRYFKIRYFGTYFRDMMD